MIDFKTASCKHHSKYCLVERWEGQVSKQYGTPMVQPMAQQIVQPMVQSMAHPIVQLMVQLMAPPLVQLYTKLVTNTKKKQLSMTGDWCDQSTVLFVPSTHNGKSKTNIWKPPQIARPVS